MIIFPSKLQAETVELTFDFTARLAPDETLFSAEVQSVVYSGTDASPELMISGAAVISGQVVTQAITGGTAGVTYLLVSSIHTSDDQVLQLAGFLTVLP